MQLNQLNRNQKRGTVNSTSNSSKMPKFTNVPSIFAGSLMRDQNQYQLQTEDVEAHKSAGNIGNLQSVRNGSKADLVIRQSYQVYYYYQMFEKQFSSLKSSASKSKREFYKEHFYVHHPLLQQMIQAKLQKCLRHGQLRQRFSNKMPLERNGKINVIEAPCIMGNQKKIESRMLKSRKSSSNLNFRMGSRPKTTYTVIRSRTSQPRIRQKLQYLAKDDQFFQESLKPTLNIQRYQ